MSTADFSTQDKHGGVAGTGRGVAHANTVKRCNCDARGGAKHGLDYSQVVNLANT